MAVRNVDRFNILCALIFERLYDWFPVPIDLECLDLVESIEGLEDHSAPEIKVFFEVFDDTMRWLEAEGFIRFQSETLQGKFGQIVLTMKGFSVLGALPAGVETAKEPIIEHLKRALGRGGASASAAAISAVVSVVFAKALGGA